MWNILQPPQVTVYRPTSSSGTIGNPSRAYDLDDYPWGTATDVVSNTGSAVTNTPDTNSVIYLGFQAVPKAQFSNFTFQTVLDLSETVMYGGSDPGGHPANPAYIVASLFRIEYSTDGGATWSTQLNLPATMLATDLTPIVVNASGFYKNMFGGNSDKTIGNVNLNNYLTNISAPISSTLFTTGLGDLRIRISNITETNNVGPLGVKSSSSSYRIWDIRAVVD